MWKGSLEIRTKGRVLFCNMAKRGKGFFTKMGGEGGLKVKRPLIPFLPTPNRGGGLGASAAVDPAAPGLGGGRDRGEKGERVAGDRSPASPLAGVLRRGGSVGAGGNGRSGSQRRRCCGSGGGGRRL